MDEDRKHGIEVLSACQAEGKQFFLERLTNHRGTALRVVELCNDRRNKVLLPPVAFKWLKETIAKIEL